MTNYVTVVANCTAGRLESIYRDLTGTVPQIRNDVSVTVDPTLAVRLLNALEARGINWSLG